MVCLDTPGIRQVLRHAMGKERNSWLKFRQLRIIEATQTWMISLMQAQMKAGFDESRSEWLERNFRLCQGYK